ncbi:glycerol-3-phosphate dehydrogenase/oxidase [Aeromicrobium camelliae]|uniref:Glycerol-3-phosphate dehydrogenase n=1 Tax=Aeromicrobium camelliae TaxID=1538144 RepID=A0A3N6WQL6_9ACTN|nr:glycerol-3-phosphate dehydrogenase/oxidase [Aeromicrobium camelliae]RQN09749.1 glycerol-3-phosphate dehydrogenase/oxidase [Aeromicrobium camelliae]
MSSSLNAARRSRDLERLDTSDAVDLVVIGGGITGVGVALDAATRGLSVVLLEQHDLAFGTSRWSSKLVHGGLRYLGTGDVGVAYESAIERHRLMTTIAPHLIRPLPQVFPLLPTMSRGHAALVRAGHWGGNLLRTVARTSSRLLPRPDRIGAESVGEYAPTVRREGLRGGLRFWDGQLVDDARLVVAVARTAAHHGATILTRCRAIEASGSGVRVRDELSGAEFDLAARTVVNAAGVWAGGLSEDINLRPSRGTHLVVDQAVLGGLTASLTVPVPGSATRFVFALPAPLNRVYIGLTDEEAPGPVPDVPVASEAEIDFLLGTISQALARPLTRSDLLGTFAGLRPLLASDTGHTADVSRRHVVHRDADGLVTVVGGKLTTYRRMAEDAVDVAVAWSGLCACPCQSTRVPLVGAGDGRDPRASPELLRGYGSEAGAVVDLAAGDPALLEPLAPDLPVTRAEMMFAVRHEGALDVDDLLDRRTRIGLVSGDRARARDAAAEAFELA